uniref:Cytoplasmic dynein 1 intermediate chain 1 n=1 Tax=Aceria tosichella TaxID=561515 RepID=A0A6G1SLZ6_9ACAR
MSDRRSVRAELERKRIQLAQMKQERERRSRLLQDETANPNNLDNPERLGDADAVLHALGLSVLSLSRASTAPSNVSSMDQSRLQAQSPESGSLLAGSSQPVTQQQLTTNLSDSCVNQQNFESTPKTAVPLQVVHVNQINIAPKERVYYTKSTQTPAPPPIQNSTTTDSGAPQTTQPKSYYGKQSVNAIPPALQTNTIGQQTPESPTTNNSLSSNTQVAGVNLLALEWDDEFPTFKLDLERAPIASIREMSEDERRQIELREDYQQFIDRATKILERALYQNESSEIFIQYFPDDGNDAIDSDRKRGNKLSLNRIFYDEKWSKNRCVTGFDWSVQYPELLLASYYTNEQAPSDPDGTLLVWNMKFKNTSPEYIFHCQSPIMSCCFAKFHPSLIVGGTYSGQIVLWDMRSNKKTPVQRSPLTAAAHTHPVYCTKVIGSQNAHNLISISTDGKLCSWSLDMLSSPQETMELNQQKQTRSVAVTCMSFHPGDYNNFLVGSEEGTVYSACRHGSKTGILSSFEGHQGLVTNVDYRPTETRAGYSHLFLTSSIDWTVKLWDTKESEPIHSFESNGDYIYDVKWSPNNPALFATADGDGRVDIWNLANDSELPTASTHIEPMSTADSKALQPSLNKLIWTPTGNQVVVGDDVGRIHVYDIGDVGEINSSRTTQQEDKWKLGEHIS